MPEFILIVDYLVHVTQKKGGNNNTNSISNHVGRLNEKKKIDETMQTTAKQINKWNKI